MAQGAVTFWEEVPYFGAGDSPFFRGIEAGAVYLEDFEDHELNTPQVTSWDWPRIVGTVNGIDVISEQMGRTHREGNLNSTWSVDADDGLNGDFRGHLGDTWTTTSRINGQRLGRMEFRFEPDILGRYPTFVGFVVTEPHSYFENIDLTVLTPTWSEDWPSGYDPLIWIPELSFPGDTRTHRFFGIHVERGITRLDIDNVAQIDHLQYGYAIPEPEAVILLLMGAAPGCLRRRKRRG